MARHTPKKRTSPIPSLGPAFLTLGSVLAIVFLGLATMRVHIASNEDIRIPVHTEGKAQLVFTISRGGAPGMMEVQLKTGTGVQMTLPSSWTLREVRGMDLQGVVSQAPTLGGRTWSISKDGIASFWVSNQSRSFQLRNTGTNPLAITVRQIFVRENRVDTQEYLVTDRPLQIW